MKKPGFSRMRLWALVKKEFINIIHDPRFLAMAFQILLVLLTVFGYAITMDNMEKAEYGEELTLIYRGNMIAKGRPAEVKTLIPEDLLEIRVDRPFEALERLEGSKLTQEVVLFGDALHAVVINAVAASVALNDFHVPQDFVVQSVMPVTPSLEDMFVSLMELDDRQRGQGEKA